MAQDCQRPERAGGAVWSGRDTVAVLTARTWLVPDRARAQRPLTTRAPDRHILPGHRMHEVPAVTPSTSRSLVAALVAKGGPAPSRPRRAASRLGRAPRCFDDATSLEPAEGLRAWRGSTTGVRGPDVQRSEDAPVLYPSELAMFLECAVVPLHWGGTPRSPSTFFFATASSARSSGRRSTWSTASSRSRRRSIGVAGERGEDGKGRRAERRASSRSAPSCSRSSKRCTRERRQGLRLQDALAPRHGARPASLARHRDGHAQGALTTARASAKRCAGRTSARRARRGCGRRQGSTEIRDVLGHTQTSMTDRYMRSAAMLRGGRFWDVFPHLPVLSDRSRRFGAGFGQETNIVEKCFVF